MRTFLLLFIAASAFGQIRSGTVTSGTIKSTVYPPVATAVDSFDRGNEDPLASIMSDGVGTWTSGPGSMDNVRIATQNIFQSIGAAGAENGARVLTPAFSPNQMASIVINTSPFEVGVITRMQSITDSSGYLAKAIDATHVGIYRLTDTGTFAYSLLGSSFTVASVGIGSKIGLASYGAIHEIFLDDVSLGTRTDSTFTGGQPAAYIFGPAGSLKSFAATGL